MNARSIAHLYDQIRAAVRDGSTETDALIHDARMAVKEHADVLTQLVNAGELSEDAEACEDSRNFQDRLYRYTHDDYSDKDRRELLLLLTAEAEIAQIPGEF